MSTRDEDAIGTFISITGASEATAVRQLEEHRGNLNGAINAYFNDNDRNRNQEAYSTDPIDVDAMDVDDPMPALPFRPPFDGARSVEDVSETALGYGTQGHGAVIINDDGTEDISSAPFIQTREQGKLTAEPSAPSVVNVPDYNDDIEEEMMQAAIEASKMDSSVSNHQYDAQDLGNLDALPVQSSTHVDPELDRAVSLSLKTAEEEKALRILDGKAGDSETESHESATPEELGRVITSNRRQSPLEVGSSSTKHKAEDAEELPPNPADILKDTEDVDVSPSTRHGQPQESEFPSEWGGISSEEHDEAVMLEAAMFGGIPEGNRHHFYAPHPPMENGYYPGHDPHRPPSPSLTAQRLLREQQDDEYLAALQADREKELKAMEEAEASLAEERRKEEELRTRDQEEQEIERRLAAKEASLPQEPPKDDENALTLLVRMPDGSRRGRRFLKSDQLQHIFDFIDIGRGIKPGSYRLVRPYPRRAFSEEERTSKLNELGLTSKQEALYLELK